MEDIPEDILRKVLTHFTVNELLVYINRVSKRYNRIISSDKKLWRHIIPTNPTFIKNISIIYCETTYTKPYPDVCFKVILNNVMHFSITQVSLSHAMQFIDSMMSHPQRSNDSISYNGYNNNNNTGDINNCNTQNDHEDVDIDKKSVISLNCVTIQYHKRYQCKKLEMTQLGKLFEKLLHNLFSKYGKKYCKTLVTSFWSASKHYKVNPSLIKFMADFQVTTLDIRDCMVPNFYTKALRMGECSFEDLDIKQLIIDATSSALHELCSMLEILQSNCKTLETIEIIGLFEGENYPIKQLYRPKDVIKQFPLPATLKNVYWTNPPEYDDWLDQLLEQTIRKNCPDIVNIKYRPQLQSNSPNYCVGES